MAQRRLGIEVSPDTRHRAQPFRCAPRRAAKFQSAKAGHLASSEASDQAERHLLAAGWTNSKRIVRPRSPVTPRTIKPPIAALTAIAPQIDPYFMVGITNSAPSFVPVGQRAVTVLVLV